MSKQWKPGKKTVELPTDAPRPSRIRREPVRLDSGATPKPRNRERELWLGSAGILLTATACAVLVIGVSEVTSRSGASAAAAQPEPGLRRCYHAAGRHCVLDGDTVYLAGQKVEIAIDAPEIGGARCPEERSRGIDAANKLRDLLNRGEVTIAAAAHDVDGRVLRDVHVDGDDVGAAMIAAGVARDYRSERRGWCG